ncbi:MAG: serine/threonine protein kinase [Candidatus Riflebacteria bacterium]|nr:serine/threonine protein kinase [Candidatus Riflebacteria bacterium]
MKISLPADCARRYEHQEHIASGASGDVHLCLQVDLARPVAVKLLKPEALGDADQVARFVEEARICARLDHPHIVAVLDAGAGTGIPWVAYEYIPGSSLRQILESEPVSVARALDVAIQVADALAAAHRAGVIHRDVKPDNVLGAGPDLFKLTDFGIARWTGADRVRTRTGTILGTPAYMAPELISRGEVSARTVLYALGVMLYELICGVPPFVAASPLAVLDMHLNELPVPPSRRCPAVSPEVDGVVLEALAKDPARRFASAELMGEALSRLADLAPGGGGRPAAGRAGPARPVEPTAVLSNAPGRSKTTAASTCSTSVGPGAGAPRRRSSRGLVVLAVALSALAASTFGIRWTRSDRGAGPPALTAGGASVQGPSPAAPAEPPRASATPTGSRAGTLSTTRDAADLLRGAVDCFWRYTSRVEVLKAQKDRIPALRHLFKVSHRDYADLIRRSEEPADRTLVQQLRRLDRRLLEIGDRIAPSPGVSSAHGDHLVALCFYLHVYLVHRDSRILARFLDAARRWQKAPASWFGHAVEAAVRQADRGRGEEALAAIARARGPAQAHGPGAAEQPDDPGLFAATMALRWIELRVKLDMNDAEAPMARERACRILGSRRALWSSSRAVSHLAGLLGCP